jgi:hypothetical protein
MGTLMVQSSGKYKSMKDNTNLLTDYHTWDEVKLGLYFKRRGLGQYIEMLKQHEITGQLAPLLSHDDLREMGVIAVGDWLMFKRYLNELSQRERANNCLDAIWEGEERIFFGDCDQNIWTLGGFFPINPSTYKLANNHLKAKKVSPV